MVYDGKTHYSYIYIYTYKTMVVLFIWETGGTNYFYVQNWWFFKHFLRGGPLVTRMDANSDGRISLKELEQVPGRSLKWVKWGCILMDEHMG